MAFEHLSFPNEPAKFDGGRRVGKGEQLLPEEHIGLLGRKMETLAYRDRSGNLKLLFIPPRRRPGLLKGRIFHLDVQECKSAWSLQSS